jgi:hypothetical protein
MKWLVILALAVLPIQPIPQAIPDFDRQEWGGRWAPTDHHGANGCTWDTRHLVLRRDAVRAETREERGKACRVTGMVLIDPYTNIREARPAGDFDVDHIVPVAEAHRSGGWRWSRERKIAYYNDLAGLVATTTRQNRQKGDKDPAGWLPAVGQCEYVRTWVQIKERWSLSMDSAEVAAVGAVLRQCQN